jgi:hypothetical protein
MPKTTYTIEIEDGTPEAQALVLLSGPKHASVTPAAWIRAHVMSRLGEVGIEILRVEIEKAHRKGKPDAEVAKLVRDQMGCYDRRKDPYTDDDRV